MTSLWLVLLTMGQRRKKIQSKRSIFFTRAYKFHREEKRRRLTSGSRKSVNIPAESFAGDPLAVRFQFVSHPFSAGEIVRFRRSCTIRDNNSRSFGVRHPFSGVRTGGTFESPLEMHEMDRSKSRRQPLLIPNLPLSRVKSSL